MIWKAHKRTVMQFSLKSDFSLLKFQNLTVAQKFHTGIFVSTDDKTLKKKAKIQKILVFFSARFYPLHDVFIRDQNHELLSLASD